MKLFHAMNAKKLSLSGMVFVCDGNSLTEGYLSSNPSTKSYPALLDADSYFNGVTFYNKGVGGQQTSQMISDASTDITPLYSSSVSCVLVAWETGNDIYYNGNATGAVNTFWSYCDARMAEGWFVIVLTCPPRDQSTSFGDNSATYNSKLDSANTLIRANWAAHANAIVDVAADSRFSGYNLTYYNADKIHYTDAGYAVVAELVKAKLQQFL